MKRILASFLTASLAAATASAQIPGFGDLPTTAPGADFATFAQLFGKGAAFTARSEVRVRDKAQQETISADMDIAMLDQKLRLEINTDTTKNKNYPAASAEAFKQLGMDQVSIIIRPDRQIVHFVFAKAGMCLNMPMDKSDLDKAEKSTVKAEALGNETLDGHPCAKSKVVITSAKGAKQELTVWRATDLKDMPIQTIEKQGDDTITTRYTKFQFTKPDPKRFEPPADVEVFTGMMDFAQGMMKKALGSGLPAGK